MKYLETKLNVIQEVEPITTITISTAIVISHLVTLLLVTSSIIKQTKVSKKYSKQINRILKSGNKWIVHIYASPTPNAFSFGFGRHLFLTSTVVKILTDDEINSILLHEAYHSSKKHIVKELAYKYPFYYIVVFVIMNSVTSGIMFPLVFLAIFILDKVGDIAFDITIARRMEYNADSYAAKHGYGQELISALDKISNWIEAHTRKKCGKWCQIIRTLDKVISDHPSYKKRVENILKHTTQLAKVLKTKNFGKIKEFVIKMWK